MSHPAAPANVSLALRMEDLDRDPLAFEWRSKPMICPEPVRQGDLLERLLARPVGVPGNDLTDAPPGLQPPA